MNKYLLLALALISSISCSKVETINIKKHSFSEDPNRIVWLQIAGLTEEILAIQRFSRPALELGGPFEESSCMGKMWNYNLYTLRPDATRGFLSQIFGTKNIVGNCSDYENSPMWTSFKNIGFQIGVLESGVKDEDSLLNSWKCNSDKTQIDKSISLWKMSDSSNKDAKRFHFQEDLPHGDGEVFYDKSCRAGICYASLENNAKAIFNKFKNKTVRSMLVVRDFSLQETILRKDVESLREKLSEIERLYAFFLSEQAKDPRLLVVVTGSGSRNIELPRSGKQWEQFDKQGKFLLYKRNSLMSPSFAKGPRAENFCGIYEESSVFERFLWSPEERKSPLSIIGL
ncbi:hypothetical protein [Halobacteriovorax sp. HLS]|uniref:hypothetical protein n=1 Tax=Halobacteriovorax sp. HLS TaxID=2234000 RepID=UPI000FDBE690|nr:hypothetical protein [Halobacteriovorax sp. HLS]